MKNLLELAIFVERNCPLKAVEPKERREAYLHTIHSAEALVFISYK